MMRAVKVRVAPESLTRAFGLPDGFEIVNTWHEYKDAKGQLWVLVEDKREGYIPDWQHPLLPVTEFGNPYTEGVIYVRGSIDTCSIAWFNEKGEQQRG